MNSGTLTMTQSFSGANHSGDANFGGTGGVGGGLMTMPGVNSTLVDVGVSDNTTGNGGGGFTGQGGRGAGIANHGQMTIRNTTVSTNVTGTPCGATSNRCSTKPSPPADYSTHPRIGRYLPRQS